MARKLIAALEVNDTRIAGIRAGTASAGVALMEEGITADELMIRADVALYQAKRRGAQPLRLLRLRQRRHRPRRHRRVRAGPG